MHRKHKVCLVGVTFAFFILLMSTATLGATTPITNFSDTKLPQPLDTNSLALIPPPPGMVSYWELNDGSGIIAVDSIGPNTGRLMDGGAWVPGIAGTALDLAPRAFVDCGGDPSLSIDRLLTIEAWVKLPDTRGIRTIVQNGDNPDNKMYHFAIEDGFLYFDRYDARQSPAEVLRSYMPVSYGTWHHVAVTMDTDRREVKFYINGTMEFHPGWYDQYTGLPYSRFSIGYGQDPMTGHSPTFFNGLIDEVAVYDAILSEQDIQLHYRNGLAGLGYLDDVVTPDLEAVDDSYTTDEDVRLNVAAPGVLANDIGVGLTAVLEAGPSDGTLALNGDGSFEYIPSLDFNGVDSFIYSVTDGVAVSNDATVTITVNAVNDAPIGVDDEYIIDEDEVLTVPAPGILGNDYDVDEDTLTAELEFPPPDTSGSLSPDGALTVYFPDDWNGITTLTYRVFDGTEYSGIVTVTIIVNPVNDAPVGEDDSYTIDEDTSLDLAAPGLLGNDYDVDGDEITLVVLTVPTHGSGSIGADGSFSYTPQPDWHGTDSMTYQAFDGTEYSDTITVTITVNPVNDAPVGVDDEYIIDEDEALTIPAPGILGNDYDVDGDTLTAELEFPPPGTSGSLSPDGALTVYFPDDWNGITTLTYRVFDGTEYSGIVTVTIIVNAVNDAPVAVDDYVVTDEDTPVIIDFMANDYDVDDTFAWDLIQWLTDLAWFKFFNHI
ncbi:MAG: Ig-like domain-containing protein [Candidatus Thorarchaeota archaeon]|jgi:hypothetical protein